MPGEQMAEGSSGSTSHRPRGRGNGLAIVALAALLAIAMFLLRATWLNTTARLVSPAPAERQIQRYPNLEAPDAVAASYEFEAVVTLDTTRSVATRIESGDTTASGKMEFTVNARGDDTLQVLLMAPDFDYRGGSGAELLVIHEDGSSTAARFRLRAPATIKDPRTATLRAFFRRRGVLLGAISRDVLLASRTSSQGGLAAPAATSAAPEHPGAERPILVRASSGAAPDLQVFVARYFPDSAGMRRYEVRAYASEPDTFTRELYLQPAGFETSVQAWYERFRNDAGLREAEGRDRENQRIINLAHAVSFGEELWQYAPNGFKAAFSSVRSRLGPRFRTIQVVSDDPITPWELMLPYPRDAAQIERPKLLGLEYEVSRQVFFRGGSMVGSLPESLNARSVDVIWPRSRDRGLPASEVSVIQTLEGFRKIDPSIPAVRSYLLSSPAGIIHYSGHGTVVRVAHGKLRYALELDDEQLDLATWFGSLPADRHTSPFYFFNACSQGQSEAILDRIDGWGPEVMRSGGSGYVGGLWLLGNLGAGEFASQFYSALARPPAGGSGTVAAVLRDVRQRFYDTGDPTYLAYVYYGSPNLRIIVRPAKGPRRAGT